MKTIHWIRMSLITFLLCALSISSVYAKTLYDDFSGNLIDDQKWKHADFVREVAGGKLISKTGNTPDFNDNRNNASFRNPELIDVIECDISVAQAVLDSGTNAQSVARVDGRFYNARNSGTEYGDIWAGIFIGDRGDGIEAWWEIWEGPDVAGAEWNEIEIGTLAVPGLAYGQTYNVTIDYDGNKDFVFRVADVSGTFTGPDRQAAAFMPYKGLETVVYADGGAGNGFVSATFDNVVINNQGAPYDDFSTAPLNPNKWNSLEFAREIKNGSVRLVSHSTGDRRNAGLRFAENHPAVETTVRVDGVSEIDPGDRGIARLDGYFYNDTYEPGAYNQYQGNVWAGIWINAYADGSLSAACSADKTLDAEDTQSENLCYRNLNLPIVSDRDYRLSILFTGSHLRFIIKDTVTGRMDVYAYEIDTPVFTPYDENRALLSRVYGNSTGGYMAVEFDDVQIDVAQPAVLYDANGEWETALSKPWADSGCDLPDIQDETITITQNGHDISLRVHDDFNTTLTGNVYGDTYTFITSEEDNGETETVYGVITLTQSTSGVGSLIFVWTDGVDRCESGTSVTITKSSTDGDGGGGGCLIRTLSR